jgi:hypothetical protein
LPKCQHRRLAPLDAITLTIRNLTLRWMRGSLHMVPRT